MPTSSYAQPKAGDIVASLRTCDPPSVGRSELDVAVEKDLEAVQENPLVIAHIPYLDTNGKQHFVAGCFYLPVRQALPKRLPTLLPTPSPAYELRDSPGKGKGLFAIRNIALGEIIVVERPSIIIPLTIAKRDISMEELFEQLATYLTKEDKEILMALANRKGDSLPPVLGVLATNGIGIRLKGGTERYGAVFPTISRVNHSCGPNAQWDFDDNTFCQFLYTARPILAGTEITSSYCGLDLSRSERLYELNRKYHFTCACPHCVRFSAESDYIRRELSLWMHKNLTYPKWISNLKRDPQALIKSSLRALTMAKQEGVEDTFAITHYEDLAMAYGALGDENNMKRWGWKAILTSRRIRDTDRWVHWLGNPQRNFKDWGKALQKYK